MEYADKKVGFQVKGGGTGVDTPVIKSLGILMTFGRDLRIKITI
jgi:hypothetical protein